MYTHCSANAYETFLIVLLRRLLLIDINFEMVRKEELDKSMVVVVIKTTGYNL